MADKAEKKKQKKQGTISQIIQIFKYTQAEDKALPWLCGGVFVAPIIVFVVLGVIFKWHVFSWILFMILAVMLGVLFATMMLTKRADKVGYAKIEGRPGAAVSVLGNISKAGFNFPQEPVWIDPKTKDAIWRGTGYNGIYLLGEGDYNRVKRAMDRQEQRIKGVKNEVGVYVTPAFPKLIYVLEEDNVREGTPYWYLTELAAKCTAKRMVPDYISEKVMLRHKIDKNGNGNCYTCMGCRSFLTPFLDENGKPKYYGRFNQGVVTVNLVDIGLSAVHEAGENATDEQRLAAFWRIFDARMELCHRALQCRHERLTGTLSDAAPILWQHGALLRLKKGEKIDKYLHGGYSTLSLGYAGLWECVYALIGRKLTEFEGEALGLDIMKKLNEYTAKWKAAETIDYSLYGTPLESTTYKFAKCLQKRFGIVPGVTDKNYITNSYHVHVTEPIDAFDKLALEAKFQALSPGGAISYVEVPNMSNNIDAVLSVMHFIYDHIMYAELNTKSDYCQACGYDGEIRIVTDETGKLVWECPKCGNRDQSRMNVARRTCGYIGTQFWNQGRTQEIRDRVLHL